MRLRKHILTCCAVLALTLCCCAFNAFALEVPTETVVRNLDGVQEYIKVYTVPPETNAEDLIELDFDYNGYTYTCTNIVKEENVYSDTKTLTENVSVETEDDDLDAILAALEPSIVYDDGQWRGVLNLDHTTIKTEATGHETRSFAVTEVKHINNLNSNDMSFVPATTVKNGVTIQLKSVDWQVQSTDLVDDVLVPASYVAIATYSGTGWYSAPTGYISTAEYVGEVVNAGIGSITYTVTYTGTPTVAAAPEPAPAPISEQEAKSTRAPAVTPAADTENSGEHSMPGFNWLWIAGGAMLLLLLALAIILIIVVRKRGAHEANYYEMEDDRYEEQT